MVPVDGQDWSTDPFAVTTKAGALFGRGTADMKGFIACTLARIPQMMEKPLLAPVHIALSYGLINEDGHQKEMAVEKELMGYDNEEPPSPRSR